MAGLYLHIPFCRKACIYCDFHFSTNLKTKTDFVNALLQEIERRSSYLGKDTISTIYFGGGTPSVLEEQELAQIMEALFKNFDVQKGAEITLEANPDDLEKEKLKVLHRQGVNRLSIGLQSFIEEELRWMNRTHSVLQNEQCVKEAQDAGFGNITVDLIYGSRFQSIESWKAALKKIEELNVQHLSCYSLTVEEKTELGLKVSKGKEMETNEDLSAAQFDILMDWSEHSGFTQYEISNFGKEGFYSGHNSSYWRGEKYAGFGPGAHSFDGVSRQWNVSNNPVYIRNIEHGLSFFEREELDERMRLNEYLLTRLRTIWGIELDFIRNAFSEKFLFLIQKQIQIEQESGNLQLEKNKIILTRQGKLIADEVTRNLMV